MLVSGHVNVCFCNFLFCLFVCLFAEEPFYLKEVYLPTDCSDCLLVSEDVTSGRDTFSSLLLFSRTRPRLQLFCLSLDGEIPTFDI